MKKILLGCLFSTMVGGMLLGNEYYEALQKAENYINKTYQAGSLANKRAVNDLAAIDAAQGSRTKKIAEIKKAFPEAFVIKNIHDLRKAAEQGDAQAQFNLGMCYANGKGVKENLTEAVEWYRKAAEQGHAQAQYELSGCYYLKYGYDNNKCIEWLRKAAEQGHIKAQYQLGYCYDKGHGVKKDPNEAVKWYRKAAEQGDSNAEKALKRLKK